MTLRDEIRSWVLIQGKSQRAAASHFGLSRNTVAKLLLEEPAANVRQYQRQAPCKTPVRDAALPHIEKWLKENEWLERWAPKQCWTAHRMWVELRKLGIPIGESTVRMYVQERRKPTKPAYIPLDFAPGERAEFDFGEATIKIKGQLVKVPFLAGRLRFSGAMFVECFPTQRQEAFLLGQHHAYEFWGGVPRLAVYDNLKPAVLQVLQGHSRREHDVFLHFQLLHLPLWLSSQTRKFQLGELFSPSLSDKLFLNLVAQFVGFSNVLRALTSCTSALGHAGTPRFWGCKRFISGFFVYLVPRIHNSIFSLPKLRNVG